ncbi:hypothetical protein D0Z67_00085 [Streptomyces seoulensis]|uniref:Uncharacterized protein n=1 Tax=Streptomyces seoulensis TaxID=73044 RepID=A0A4P6TP22_STRSO|nr:hypothetical protein D0Z67_00085 [Streptomyces seoulensis]
MSTVVWFGSLAAVSVPLTGAAGLFGLWVWLACAKLLQGVGESGLFVRRRAWVRVVVPLAVGGGDGSAVPGVGRGR